MELSGIAGAAVQMTNEASRETLSLLMVKQANDAQKQIADMLQTLVAQQTPDPNYKFSLYA